MQQLWASSRCLSYSKAYGGSWEKAFEYAASHGVCDDSCAPYKGKDGLRCEPCLLIFENKTRQSRAYHTNWSRLMDCVELSWSHAAVGAACYRQQA